MDKLLKKKKSNMLQDSSSIEETHDTDHLFFKTKSYKLKNSFHGFRITKKKKSEYHLKN